MSPNNAILIVAIALAVVAVVLVVVLRRMKQDMEEVYRKLGEVEVLVSQRVIIDPRPPQKSAAALIRDTMEAHIRQYHRGQS